MTIKSIKHDYAPRSIFNTFHRRKQRWSIMVVHRRGGKTVAKVNDTINRILYFKPPIVNGLVSKDPGRFAYVAPFLKQAREIAWDYLKRYSQGMTKKVSEADLSITYFNDCKYTLFGADNPDSFRGQYFDGVDLDEYGMMKPSVWSEVLLPALIDRRGWASFIGTPNGPNHFRDLVRNAIQHPENWFYEVWPVSITKLIPEEELAEMRRLMTKDEYAQEMECSFEASTRGAFYSDEVATAVEEGRIRPLEVNRDMELHFVLDLGFTDDTAIIGFQEALDGYPILHAESDNLKPIKHYIQRIQDICKEYGCKRGVVWLPHDAKAKTLQTGRSIVEQFVAAGIRPQIVPSLSELDGIAAARLLFPEVWINSTKCVELIEALKTFRRKWDEDKKAYSNLPLQDWSVHYADCFRYFAIVAKKEKPGKASNTSARSEDDATPPLVTPYTLNDLWELRNAGRPDFIH